MTIQTASGDVGKMIAVHTHRWSDSDSKNKTGNRTYHDCPGSEFSFTSQELNSTFLLTSSIWYYGDSNVRNGANTCFRVSVDGGNNYDLLGGTEGSSGDSWRRFGHNSWGGNAIFRMCPWKPQQPKGTTLYVKAGWGFWDNRGVRYLNYSGYGAFSEMTIYEFSPTV